MPPGGSEFSVLRGVQAQIAQTLGGDGWLEAECQHLWGDWMDELKALSQLVDLVVIMTESLPMISMKQPLWVGTADFNRRGSQSKLPLLPSPLYQAVVL